MTRHLGEISSLFLKLGIVGFGGPAAHIAMMEDEVVTRRKWMSPELFLDLVGATNLIPGPNSTEMTMHVGYHRGGYPGLAVAGASFILPAVLITALIAWFYVRYAALPAVEVLLSGIRPAVIVIIFFAVLRLGRKAARSWQLAGLGAVVAIAAFVGLNPVTALLLGGLLGMVGLRGRSGLADRRGLLWSLTAVVALLLVTSALMYATENSALFWQGGSEISLAALFFYFLVIGSVLYGSGYVLFAFLDGGLVHNLGWLSQQQLLDAIAVGQFTPGPVLSTSTFIGYVISGGAGALLATLGIFLPSFLFVAALSPLVPKMRRSPWVAAFLDAVNVSAVGLMAAVLVSLGISVFTAWQAVLIAVLAAAAYLRWNLSAIKLVLGGAAAGWLLFTSPTWLGNF
ncbi:MAG: chromate efflux transporter [Caldilineales bacterium]|nr:chromate efflux transporter [Caldilineales bacterium]